MRRTLAALAVLLALAPKSAAASGGSNSKSDSSNGSKDSSNGSKDSSNNSKDSSNKSGDSTKTSPEDSTKGSTDETSESSKTNEAKIITVVGAIVIVGVGVGAGITLTAQTAANERVAQMKLSRFLARNHAMVTRDVAVGEGPVLSAWATELGLSAEERVLLHAALEGSAEQTRMLETLSSPLAAEDVATFARQFCAVTARVVGTDRMRVIAQKVTGMKG